MRAEVFRNIAVASRQAYTRVGRCPALYIRSARACNASYNSLHVTAAALILLLREDVTSPSA